MNRNKLAQMELVEGSLASFCLILVWVLVGLIGLFFLIGIVFSEPYAFWNQRGFYYSLVALLVVQWRIARVFVEDRRSVQAWLQRNAPPFLVLQKDK